MIGIIAGEIIGSPYRKENIPDINRIFFPLCRKTLIGIQNIFEEALIK